MAYVVLARKYRPRKLEEVVGQEAIATTLRNAIQSQHVAHAYLFAGPRGVGKTSMARILAAALNCQKGPAADPCGECQSCRDTFNGEDVDVIEIDGASNNGVENIRDLRSNAAYSAAHSRNKIYIIDEVHMLSTNAFNALLKTLEEPPAHVKFIFATTEPHKVIETVQSRCQRFDFRNISTNDIVKRLVQICESEGVKAEEQALWMVARRARGGMRDSQSYLDQLIAYDAKSVTVESVGKVLGRSLAEETFDLLDIIARRDPAAALNLIERLSSSGDSAVEFLEQFQEALRNLMVLTAAGSEALLRDLPADEVTRLGSFGEKFSLQSVMYMLAVVSDALRRARTATQRRMLVELALVKLATMEDMSSLSDILAQLEAIRTGGAVAQPTRAAAAPRPAAPPKPVAQPKPATHVEHAPAAKKIAEPPAEESTTQSAPESAGQVARSPEARAWQEVIERLKAAGKRSTAALVQEGLVQKWSNGEMVVGFAKGFDWHRRQLDEAGTRKEVERILSEVMGQAVRLKVIEAEGGRDESRDNAEGQSRPAPKPTAKQTDKASGTSHVRKAVDLFRGKIQGSE